MSAFHQKQLILNALPLPLDTIRRINEFLVSEKACPLAKQLKYEIHLLISESKPRNWIYGQGKFGPRFEFVTGERNLQTLEQDLFIYCISEDDNCPKFMAYFCEDCGNYRDYPPPLLCVCR